MVLTISRVCLLGPGAGTVAEAMGSVTTGPGSRHTCWTLGLEGATSRRDNPSPWNAGRVLCRELITLPVICNNIQVFM